jgi:tRNA-2-methylthio-N6-dimethylallyladenosine synthase
VTLLGQNVNSYGDKESGEISFQELFRKVAAVEGLLRLRFTTSHPKDLSDELIACFGDLDNLCHQLHLPVQCGSNEILEQMNRGYSREDYLLTVQKLKTACPDIRLSTDIIVGFPGETEENFQQTLDLVAEVGYADAFTFLYSKRTGTPAAEIEDKTGARIKQQRFDRLLELQHSNSRNIWESDLGQSFQVLVEGPSKQGEGQMFGRTTANRIVNFAGDAELIGAMVDVKITQVFRNSNLGELQNT